MRTDRAVTRMSSDRVATRPIVDGQTPVKTLPSLAVGNKYCTAFLGWRKDSFKTEDNSSDSLLSGAEITVWVQGESENIFLAQLVDGIGKNSFDQTSIRSLLQNSLRKFSKAYI